MMRRELEQEIEREGLLPEKEGILVAVSGGIDSMVLFHLLRRRAERLRHPLAAAHLNHRLRGRAGDEDARFVAETLRHAGVQCVVGEIDVGNTARKDGLSIEMAARRERHRFLAETARKLKLRYIALAHHADDQLELFFLRLLRGAGATGLAGMPPRADSPFDPALSLLRPLLRWSKEQLTSVAGQEGIAYREDSTNADSNHLRNRVRNRLLPYIRELFPGTDFSGVARSMQIVRDQGDLVTQTATQWPHQSEPIPFDSLHPAIQREHLRLRLLELGEVPSFDWIETLRRNPGHPVTTGQERRLQCRADGTVERLDGVRGGPDADGNRQGDHVEHWLEMGSQARGSTEIEGATLQWRVVEAEAAELGNSDGWTATMDADKAGRHLCWRHWQAGDRWQPLGMQGRLKLQDFFVNEKVALQERRRRFIVTTASGEIIWVEGFRISEQVKITGATRRLLQWTLVRPASAVEAR